MNRFVIVSLFALIVVTGYLTWWYKPAQIITRQTKGVIECLDIPQTATKTYRALKTNSFSNYLANTVACRVDIADYRRELSRDTLIESHHYFAHNVSWASAKATDTKVTIINEAKASSHCEIEFSLNTKKSESFREKAAIRMDWEKNEAGKWLLTALEMNGDSVGN